MMRSACVLMLVCLALVAPAQAQDTKSFSFGVIASGGFDGDERTALRTVIQQADAANLAFVVTQGIKGTAGQCSDAAYQQRRNLIDSSQHGLIVSLGTADWAACSNEAASTASAKLTRVRELFFDDEFSFGATRLPLVRQSTEAKFHDFVENARWEIGETMFATINLPKNNNHFVMAAGRNGEFEDRLVANREWLRRVFTYAQLKKLGLIVLFAEANPLVRQVGVRRDGFIETRRHILALAGKLKGKVLLIHAQPAVPDAVPAIKWRANLGEVGIARNWIRFDIDPAGRVPIVAAVPGRDGQ